MSRLRLSILARLPVYVDVAVECWDVDTRVRLCLSLDAAASRRQYNRRPSLCQALQSWRSFPERCRPTVVTCMWRCSKRPRVASAADWLHDKKPALVGWAGRSVGRSVGRQDGQRGNAAAHTAIISERCVGRLATSSP